MGLLDNVLGSGSGSAVPGGNVTKPLMIALLALLASRYMSGGSKEAPASAGPGPAPKLPGSMPDPSPGAIVGGLGGLLKQFQQKGLGGVADSWIKTGPNDAVAPGQISDALGPDVIDTLSQRTGLSKDQVSQILSQVLPNVVDQFTPQGRLPSQQELARLMG
jgi:uncharacterized protein YidB (DUF937 family)